ncbi:metal ion transporter, metal ion transporter family, partial [Cooperia oncophora]
KHHELSGHPSASLQTTYELSNVLLLQYFVVAPPLQSVLAGAFIPWCEGCGRDQFLQGISIVGAVIMPHNLYLHSALVKSRRVDRSKKERVEEANFYFTVESAIALTCSFFINVFVVAVFAHGFYEKTNYEVVRLFA